MGGDIPERVIRRGRCGKGKQGPCECKGEQRAQKVVRGVHEQSATQYSLRSRERVIPVVDAVDAACDLVIV